MAESAGSRQVWKLQSGKAHVLHMQRRTCKILEVEDTHFNFGSAVFIPPEKRCSDTGGTFRNTDFSNQELRSELEKDFPALANRWYNLPYEPECEPAPSDDGTKHFDDLRILAAIYRYAPEQDVLLAGHTDTMGSNADNQKLSEVRAKSIYCLLLGKLTDASNVAIFKNEWYKLIQNRSKVEDYQCILTHFSERSHWDCHPGPIDGVYGTQTSEAVKNFQDNYNLEFQANISVDGVVGEKTWKAMFDVYMRELAELVGGEDELRMEQAKLQQQFIDDQNPVIGCGERYPIEAQGQDNCRSKKNRRVEILYFPTGQGPAKETAEDQVYKRRIYDYRYISPNEGGETGPPPEPSAWGNITCAEIETPDFVAEELNGSDYCTESDIYPEDEEDPLSFLAPLGNTGPLMNQKPENQRGEPVE
jgi:peptidoglycan hydrolase-like protein with peptidoglycan-binding domain